MKLGDGEEKIAEYYLKGLNDVANMSILTNRRLIVVYGNAEESYPLSKIAALKIIFNHSWLMLIVGVIIALIGLVMLGDNVAAGIIAMAVGGGLGYLGWKGKTQLLINQMGGMKYYKVMGKDQKLIDFMDMVNSKLS